MAGSPSGMRMSRVCLGPPCMTMPVEGVLMYLKCVGLSSVCVCLRKCVYVRMYVCMHAWVYVCVKHVCLSVYVSVSARACACVWMYGQGLHPLLPLEWYVSFNYWAFSAALQVWERKTFCVDVLNVTKFGSGLFVLLCRFHGLLPFSDSNVKLQLNLQCLHWGTFARFFFPFFRNFMLPNFVRGSVNKETCQKSSSECWHHLDIWWPYSDLT